MKEVITREPTLLVMVVGVPNVGKSALINSIHQIASSRFPVQGKMKKATVGPLPGVTQDIAGYKIAHQPSIYVLDSPGVLVPIIPDIETGLKLALPVLGKKYRDLSSNNDWEPFKSLSTEVTSAIKEQKEQTLLGKLEESRLKEEKTVLENQTLRQEIQRLKQELALKKDLVDPDTTLTLRLPGTTSQKLITPDVENDVENLIQMK